MKQKTVKIMIEDGLHMRPAMTIAKAASKFSSNIKINKANAKSIMELTVLVATKGEYVTITTEGEDEYEALFAIEELITEGLVEKEV